MKLEQANSISSESKPYFTRNFNFYFLPFFRITNETVISYLVKERKFLSKHTPQRMFHHSKLSTSLNRLKSKELQAKSTFYYNTHS